MLYIFVGERQSPKAAQIGATWQTGQLAARTLHEVLRALGINPDEQVFVNLWETPGLGKPAEAPSLVTVVALRKWLKIVEGVRIVALGCVVAKELERLGIPHLRMVHPAARGRIRKRERYVEHARSVLIPAAAS